MCHRSFPTAALVIATAILALLARAQPPVAPTNKELNNVDFSASAVGDAPAGWTVTSTGFKAVVVADDHSANKLAAELRPPWGAA